MMNILCIFGFHKWDGCMCITCSKTRDKAHDWSKDCERCAKCGATRQSAHKWNGCMCLECGKTCHDWIEDCEKCSHCGATRIGAHDWTKDCETCATCGKSRRYEYFHNWDRDDKCIVCGKTKPPIKPLPPEFWKKIMQKPPKPPKPPEYYPSRGSICLSMRSR
jgi:hypothetical protein